MGVRRRSPGAGPRRALLEPNHGQRQRCSADIRGQPRHITCGVTIQEAQRGMPVPPLLQTSAVDPLG